MKTWRCRRGSWKRICRDVDELPMSDEQAGCGQLTSHAAGLDQRILSSYVPLLYDVSKSCVTDRG
jgi:hypothetical protein